jgi:putative transposase
MARQLRLEFAGALYHVTSRGDGKEDIYFCDKDRWLFLNVLGKACERYNLVCHAYCLMNNHYHLLIETPDPNLSRGMRHLNGVYTQRINRSHDLVGHLFQGRYQAILVDKSNYLLELSRYIVLNPVRAHLVDKPENWFWSSFNSTVGLQSNPTWLHSEALLLQFGGSKHVAIARYRQFVLEGINASNPWEALRDQIYLGSEEFAEELKKLIDDTALSEFPRAHHRRIPKSLSDYDKEFENRDAAMFHAYYSGDYKQWEIADYYGVHYTTVSRAIKRFESR